MVSAPVKMRERRTKRKRSKEEEGGDSKDILGKFEPVKPL